MFLFFNIITKFTTYYYTITHIKLINYYWHLCQCSNLSFFIINVIILSGILVRSFSMKINSYWIKISFSSNPESFQILAIEIGKSSMFKSRDFIKKKLKIQKEKSESVSKKNRQHNAQEKKERSSNTNPTNTGGKLRCSGRVSSSCSTNGTHRVNLVTHPVISDEWGNNRKMFTSGTYSWSTK